MTDSSLLLLLIVAVLALAAGAGLGAFLAFGAASRRASEDRGALRDEMRDTFAALSRDALRDSNSSLIQTAEQTLRARQDAIDALVKPVRETLDKVQQQVVRADRDRESSFSAVKEQLASLSKTQELLRASADGLSRSLRSPHTRGKWGEIQL
jgi:DNA recombination protein RmuC